MDRRSLLRAALGALALRYAPLAHVWSPRSTWRKVQRVTAEDITGPIRGQSFNAVIIDDINPPYHWKSPYTILRWGETTLFDAMARGVSMEDE